MGPAIVGVKQVFADRPGCNLGQFVTEHYSAAASVCGFIPEQRGVQAMKAFDHLAVSVKRPAHCWTP
jgi:hypothetical protein